MKLTVANLSPSWQERWQERVSIMMADAGLTLDQAKALAFADVVQRIRRDEQIGGRCPCAACAGQRGQETMTFQAKVG
jgi:hypothetical protein